MKFERYMAVASLLVTGCASTSPTIPTFELLAIFDEAAARSLIGQGTNTIKGTAFMRQQGGGVVTCAGQTVYLVPATAYATERVRTIYGNADRGVVPSYLRYQFVPDPGSYRTLVKTTRCDAQGSFVFESVADGDFYLNTLVSWQVGGAPQGGQLMQRVTVSGGRSVSVVVAP